MVGNIGGYYVETRGAERWQSVAWYVTRVQADEERERIMRRGAWGGMPPRVTAARQQIA